MGWEAETEPSGPGSWIALAHHILALYCPAIVPGQSSLKPQSLQTAEEVALHPGKPSDLYTVAEECHNHDDMKPHKLYT